MKSMPLLFPGSPIYVSVGTIQAADEGQLAGVLAHEMSHIVLRHGNSKPVIRFSHNFPLGLGSDCGARCGEIAGATRHIVRSAIPFSEIFA